MEQLAGGKIETAAWSCPGTTLTVALTIPTTLHVRDGLVFYLILNSWCEPQEFELPALAEGRRWIDTFLPSPDDISDWDVTECIPGFIYSAGPGMNGAPAESPSNSRPIANGSSSRSNRAMPSASAGAMIKFASSENGISLMFRSGNTICCSVSPRPISDILARRNTTTEIFETAANNAVTGWLS